ncbi:uncharacterized membrane-anchored protein YhcB (DUF1043 family) [Inhella inkyongensis]|uniref:Uncharacterized membrane-anchored protein YhcB (DUF1043 family) n=1 Tax=Inhella inkyongensis TaxID=392593 RepID=A0A840S634_9BURK|nr:histidine kinase [Inhella inkyongensis]MBB5205875.1 uncharacterized membrane-anchored protein YhcB (DUF1043 family) [Inhella inkyongensis]
MHRPTLPPLRRWLPHYLGLLLGLGLLLSLAAWQDYRQAGGQQHWEPFLWEFSSVAWVGPLALLIHLTIGRMRDLAWPWLLLGALGFNLLHVSGMFALRFAVYSLLDQPYQPDPLPDLLLYEGAKDLVSFGLIVGISRGIWAVQQANLQAQELERTRRELAEAKLARLSEQVQPHFLFNSLNLIAEVMHQDVERADRLLCDLAQLLRQSLAAQERGLHRLEDELALVTPFLHLMQTRFGAERLQVQIDVSPEARACMLPALLLLAPVENVIKHDVARHQGRVQVQLSARRVLDRLHIQLDNDGVDQPPPVDGGLGLRNLRERLAAHYGDLARVDFGPADRGMRLRLELPASRDLA